MNRIMAAVLPLLLFTASSAPAAPSHITTAPPKNCAALLARMPANSEFMRIQTKKQAETDQLGMHNRLDLNHDGFVTFDELMQWAKRQANVAGEPSTQALPLLKQIFAKGDTNRDGKISTRETLAAANIAFDRSDLNHDGRITPAERCAAMNQSVNQEVRQVKRPR